MTSFEDADDSVVLGAYALLRGKQTEGSFNLRRVEQDDRTDFVYRIDPEAETTEISETDITSEGEFPDANPVLWRADRDRIERELDRRELQPG